MFIQACDIPQIPGADIWQSIGLAQHCTYLKLIIIIIIIRIIIIYYLFKSHYMSGQAHRVPGDLSSQISRQSPHEVGKVVRTTHWPPLYPRNYSWYSFLRLIQPQGPSAAGRIMSTKNSSDIIGNRTRDLPDCSTVSQPTAPPRTPNKNNSSNNILTRNCPYFLKHNLKRLLHSNNDVLQVEYINHYWTTW
jgi:hypothetical protein